MFQTSAARGFLTGETAVVGVVLADALYILLAILGIGVLLEKYPKARRFLNIGGGVIIAFFGLAKLLSLIGIVLLPSLSLAADAPRSSALVYALLITLSNPMTILFWTGRVLGAAGFKQDAKARYVLFRAGRCPIDGGVRFAHRRNRRAERLVFARVAPACAKRCRRRAAHLLRRAHGAQKISVNSQRPLKGCNLGIYDNK